MLSRERRAGRIEANVVHSKASSQPKLEHSFGQPLTGSNLPIDERKAAVRCTPRTRAGLKSEREELPICGTSEGQHMDCRNSKRRRGGDIVAQTLSLVETEVREGLRLQRSPAEVLRKKKGSLSCIASADVPLAVGSEVGNKRRRRALAKTESKAFPSSNGEAEENERRSERLKERRKLEKEKNPEENRAIDGEIQIGSVRWRKSSCRPLQQKGNRGKSEVQAKKHVKGPWSPDRERGMSSASNEEGHGEQGGLVWTSRLRERAKKRVLEFCAEVKVEAFAQDARIVKQKVEKAAETPEGCPEQTAEELNELFARSWLRKHPRSFRTRARFQSLLKEESQAGITGETRGVEVDHLPSTSEEKQLVDALADAAIRSVEREIGNGCHVSSKEHFNPSIQETASKSLNEKFRASTVQDSFSVEGRTDHPAVPDVPKVSLESKHFEALEVESEKQIEIVLDLGIKPSREVSPKDFTERITGNTASSSGDMVSSSLQTRASASCESAEAPSVCVGVRSDSSLISEGEVLGTREHQTCEEISRMKVLEVALSTSCKEVVKEKLVEEEVRSCCVTGADMAVESRDHRACGKFPQEVVNVVDKEMCKENREEVVEVHELTACSEDASWKVVEGGKHTVCTKFVKETVLEVPEHRRCLEFIHRNVLEVAEERVSVEVLEEKVVNAQEGAFCSGITRQRAVEGLDRGVSIARASEKVVEQEHIVCHEVEKERVAEMQGTILGNEIVRQRVHERQEHVVHTDLDNEEVPEGQEQKFCDGVLTLMALKDENRRASYNVAKERVPEVTQSRIRGEISEEEVVEVERYYSVCEEMMTVNISDAGEHILCTDAVKYAAVKDLKCLEDSENILLEGGDQSTSGNCDENLSASSCKEVPRGAEDSAGNSVDDFDVLAKYCSAKSRKNNSRTIVEKLESLKVISENGTFEDENLEISSEDPGPSCLKVSISTCRSERPEENCSEDREETAGTRSQALLDVLTTEVNATPELGESSDCREVGVSLGVSHCVQTTEGPRLQNAVTKERAGKYSNDFKRGFVSLGLKCSLCGGSSDGKWASELRSGRKTKGRDGSNYGSQKMSELDEKGLQKLQVKKGWLGRLLGPLSERVGVGDAWIHEECAVWSPEVYFVDVGKLKNVKAALRRGRLLKCSYCGQPGATIGCRLERCAQNYHLPCAHFDGCSFDHKKYLVACADHLHLFPSRCRKFLEYGSDIQTGGSGEMEDNPKLDRGNFRTSMIKRRAAASTARLKDIEEEEKCMEKWGEDEEFARRERKRLQRDLARIVPMKLGGRKTDSEDFTIPDGWNSVAGLQNVVQCLKEMVIVPLIYPGTLETLGIEPPRGVLLHGHSGTGKTLVVRALAGACARGPRQISYFARKGADCLGKYVGDAERQLRLLFQVAEEHQPSIIFFDEIDGLAPSRSRDGQDQTHSSVVSTLLALMDGLSSRGSVIVVGATNRPDALDPALRRPGRFDREIYFPLPSVADRAAILALHTQSWVPPPSAEVLSTVARGTRGFAGADLRALCVEVALKSLKRVAPIHRLMESAERRQTGDILPRLPKSKVRASDWANALREAPPPCSMRMTRAALSYIPGSPLPWYLVPSLLPALVEVLLQLHRDGRCSFPPALCKAVSFIYLALQSFAQRSELSEPESQYKWMALVHSGGHELVKSVEVALTSAGLVGNVEGLSECGVVEPPCADGLSAKPSEFDVDSSASIPKYNVSGDWRGCYFRVLISGKGKRGQRLLSASLIAGFEGFCETRTLNLPTMLYEGDGDAIQGLNRILGSGKGSTPCMLFMPQIESWSMVREDIGDESPRESKTSCTRDIRNFNEEAHSESALRSDVGDRGNSVASISSTWSFFLQHIKCLCPNTSIMFLATSHLPLDELPSKVVDFFLSDTTSCKEKHVVSRNQPVPCSLIELPPLREHLAVVERASQDISRSLAGRFMRFLNHNEEFLHRSYASATSKPADPGLQSDERPKVGIRDGRFDNGDECLVDAKYSKPVEQITSSVVSDLREHSRPSSCLADLTLKPDGMSSLEDCPVPMIRPRTLPGSWSSEERALQCAIAHMSNQILDQEYFADLRRISAKINAGPCTNTSIVDPRILGTANHFGNISFPGDNMPLFDIFDRRDEKYTHASQVYGLTAVGLKGKSGLYSSGTEFACEVTSVLKLLKERVKSKVKSRRDYSVYVPLLSKVSGLQDLVSSWSYQTRRLESDAKVLGGVQSSSQALHGTKDVSQPGRCGADEAALSFTHESSDPKGSFCKIHEKVGEISPEKGHCGDENLFDIRSFRGNNGSAVIHSQMMDAGTCVLDSSVGCDTALVLSDNLAAEGKIANDCCPQGNLGDPCRIDPEVNVEASILNDVKSQDTTNMAGSAAVSSEDGACQPPSRENQPQKRRVYIKSESLDSLDRSIRKMIVAAWEDRSAESVELLYDIIASCGTSIRIVSDRLTREVEWTTGCQGKVPCPVGREGTTKVGDGFRREVCLCLLTEAVGNLTTQSNKEAVNISETGQN